MARIAGVNIPTGKRVPIALQYIHGIGPHVAEKICESLKIDRARRVNELADAEVLPSANISTPTSPSRATCAAK